MKYMIQKAVIADAMGIAIVQAYTWLTTYKGLIPDHALESRVNGISAQADYLLTRIGKDDAYFVVESMNTIIGFAACSASRNVEYPDDGEIQAIYLLKGFQENGIGKAMFDTCVKFIREQGHDHMIVNCLEGNLSLKFYCKMGGKTVGMREDIICGGM